MTEAAEPTIPVRPVKMFLSAIAAVGAVRFALSVAGLPDEKTRYASMTAIIVAGVAYFALTLPSWRKRLIAAYLLILPYMVVELSALGYEWATGRHTVFHAPQYSFRTPVSIHFLGHFVGGLTWEPLILFLLMEIIRAIYVGFCSLLHPKTGSAG